MEDGVERIIQVSAVTKTFRVGPQNVEVLKGITFAVKKGQFIIIFGPSGCGKSTLMNVILGLEKPTSGSVIFQDQRFDSEFDEDEAAIFRKNNIGIVYQQSNWIKSLTVRENVAFPLLLLSINKNEALNKSIQALSSVGMLEWADYIPTELSSGQQQKVALARAMVNNPSVIFADEPTGNLDFESGQDVMLLLKRLNDTGKTIIMVTHDLEYISYANSAVKMFDGLVEGVYEGPEKEALLTRLHSKKVTLPLV